MNQRNNVTTQSLPVRLWQVLRGAIWLLLACGTVATIQAQTQGVVPYNQVWKFEQSNIDLGTTWRDPGFDDSGPGWGTGVGPLGFPVGEGMFSSGLTIQTVLNRTTNGIQPRTYYFRTTFVFSNDPTGVSLLATNLIDDAAVFYLNGVELARVAFPPPPTAITFASEGSRAASDVNTYGYDLFTNTAPNLIQGTNTFAVEVHQTGGGSSDLVFATRLLALIPQAVAITSQPTNQTVPVNRVVNLSVGVSGFPPPTFQWYKDSSPILLDATSATFTITNSALSDTGDYYVVVSNALNVVTSSVARLTVVDDTNGPVLLSIRTDDTFRKITLTWDELLFLDSATEEGNFYILDPEGNQVTVNLATLNGNVITLDVPAMVPGTNYTIEVDYQQDLVGNSTLPVGTPANDPNGIVTNFQTFVIAPGFTRFQAYLNRPSAETLATFVTLPVYPSGSSFEFYTNVTSWPQSVPGIEQYVMRFSGLFVAPADGLYSFNPGHDDEMRLRVHTGADQSSSFTELAAACCTLMTDGPGLDVTLVGGQSYFYELLVREFTGGDHAGIAVVLPSGVTNSPISQQYLAVAYDPAQIPNVNIATQPQNQSIEENHAATFSVTATNGGGATSYQWQVDAGTGFTNIAGANGASYTTPLQPIANSGHQYRVIVSVPGRSVTSSAATLTVGPDPTAPRVTAVRGTPSFAAIRVTFNEAMDSASVTEGSNYTLTDSAGNPVTSGTPVLSADLMTVTIPTGTQLPGSNYTLRVENVTDLAGNPIVTTNITFPAWVYSRGFALQELWFNLGGSVSLDTLTNQTMNPRYPNSPDLVRYRSLAELNTADEFDNYGARISALYIAPVSGNYTFYLASDDNGELWLSTDANPANIGVLGPVAREPVWSNRREWTGLGGGAGRGTPSPSGAATANIATNIALVAGESYYFEALMKEGGGGDNLGVAVQLPGGSVPVNGTTPGIGGAYLAALADPYGAVIAFTQQPSSLTATQGQVGSLTVGVLGTNVNGSAPVFYQWQRLTGGVFTDIAGANTSNYLTAPLTGGDSGAQFRALVFIPGASATSSVATITVGGAAPTLRSSYNNGALTLSWDSPARLQCATSLSPADWKDVELGGATTHTVYPSNEFNVNPDAIQEVPSLGGRTGSGSGTVTLSNNVLLVDVVYSGLSGTRNASHFHAPAGRGTNVGVAYSLQAIDTGNGATSGTIRGSIPLADGVTGKPIAGQIQDIRKGLWYLNIHTSTFAGGEIRGQVDPGIRFYRLVSP